MSVVARPPSTDPSSLPRTRRARVFDFRFPARVVAGSRAIARPLRTRPARALLWFAVFAAVPYLHPKLARLRLFRPTGIVATADDATGIVAQYGEGLTLGEAHNEPPPIVGAEEDEPALLPPPPAGSGSAVALPALNDEAKGAGVAFRPIEDPTGHAMDAFYASLARTDSGAPEAVTRVAHYGDSLIVSDFMSATLRRRFQARFGDAGHGWVLIAKPWAWYFHQDVSFWSSDGWMTNRIVNPRIADEMYGYGGASFRSSQGGIKATFATAKPPPRLEKSGNSENSEAKSEKEAFGRRVSRFSVHYLEQPEGGVFDLSVDGKKVQTVSTRAPAGGAKALRAVNVDTDDGAHTLELRVVGGVEVRAFGVALERRTPGVVWDALGVNGARARLLAVNDHAHWVEALRLRDPRLVVLQYGTNESEDTGYPMERYEETLEEVLRLVREALPQSSCLVVGPMDRAGHGAGGMETRPIIPKLENAQRKVAFKVGCAFWDTWLAMGGPGAMGRWYRATPRLGGGDLTHPTVQGAALLGDLLYAALMQGYESRPRPPVITRAARGAYGAGAAAGAGGQ